MSAADAGPRTALVTGASSGIGAAVACAFAKLGWRVALCARREDRLQQVAEDVREAGGTPFVHTLDVSLLESIDALFDALAGGPWLPDVVVNNAGVCIPNLLHEGGAEALQSEITTNLLGPMWIARRALPSMIERGRGDLVFVSSENATTPRTFQAGYTASKCGLEGLARVLEMELEGTGVRSTIVRPGPTGSEFGRDWDPAILRRILDSWKYWGVQRNLHWMPAEAVAQAVVRAVTTHEGAHQNLVQVMPLVRNPSAA
jgi:NAD(P)-dependent dehydrogenase (short-subunit alcohol dehydrogenase family)